MKKLVAALACFSFLFTATTFAGGPSKTPPPTGTEHFANSLYIGIFGGPYQNHYLPRYRYFETVASVAQSPLDSNTFHNDGGSGGLSLGYTRQLSPTLSALLEADGILNSRDNFRESNHVPNEAEYAYRYFGTQRLQIIDAIPPLTPPRPANSISRTLQIQSNAVYVGATFNLNFS